MDASAQPEKLAMVAAEEILRVIYGDDFQGCTVSLEAVAAIIDTSMKQRGAQDLAVLEMYEKVIESLHRLSTPPDASQVDGPEKLRSLLAERLDVIHSLTQKTIETTARLKAVRIGN